MAAVTVRLPRLLADVAGTGRTLTVAATTAAEALDALCAEIPALRVHVFDDRGAVRRHVNIFVRGELVPESGLGLAVADDDEVAVVQAVSGG